MSRSLEYVVFAAAKDIAGYEGSVYDDAIKALKDAGKLGGNK